MTWEFDAMGRRIRQTTYDGSTGSYVATEDLKFISDGWRNIAELNAANNALVRSYVWGLDLSGTMDGAGGVGGLLMINSAANGTHFYAYDGNGNATALVKASDGTKSATYEYDPFGKVLCSFGAMAQENQFRFSTKRLERTTDLGLYEFRPRRTEWLSRDPLQEPGFELVANRQNGVNELKNRIRKERIQMMRNLLQNSRPDVIAAFEKYIRGNQNSLSNQEIGGYYKNPLGESGKEVQNLYAFIRNCGINEVDYLGLKGGLGQPGSCTPYCQYMCFSVEVPPTIQKMCFLIASFTDQSLA